MKSAKQPTLRTIGFVGDTHCGSHYGLWPLDSLPARGHAGPRYLLKCFQHLTESWPELDLLVLMGDLIDGKQRKSDGTKLFTTKLDEQADGAIEILQPMAAKAKQIIRVDGTPYHEDFHGACRLIDAALGIKVAKQVIDLDLGPGILNIAHHPIGGSTLYNGTQTDKEAIWSRQAASAGKTPSARWIVRAHRHCYHLQDDEQTTVVICPCWELPTPYAKKGNYWKWQPSLGGLLMLADEAEDEGYRFRKTVYPLPTPDITRLDNAQPQAKTSAAKRTRTRGDR